MRRRSERDRSRGAVSRIPTLHAISDSQRAGRLACSGDLGANRRPPPQFIEICGTQIHTEPGNSAQSRRSGRQARSTPQLNEICGAQIHKAGEDGAQKRR